MQCCRENVLIADEGGEWRDPKAKLADFGMNDNKNLQAPATERLERTTSDASSAARVHDTDSDRDKIVPFGTWEYMSPECYKRKYGEPCSASDVFSFGVLVWEMIACDRPYTAFPGFQDEDQIAESGNMVFDEQTGKQIVNVKKIAQRLAEDQRPAASAGCPTLLRMLMEACWVREMDKRPSAAQLLDVVQRLREKEGALDPCCASEISYDEFLEQLGLKERKEDLAEYLSEPGKELTELKQMDEDDLDGDILEDGDLGLTEDEQAKFRAAVQELKNAEEGTIGRSAVVSYGDWLTEHDFADKLDQLSDWDIKEPAPGSQEAPPLKKLQTMLTEEEEDDNEDLQDMLDELFGEDDKETQTKFRDAVQELKVPSDRDPWDELQDALGARSLEEEEEVGEKVKAQLAKKDAENRQLREELDALRSTGGPGVRPAEGEPPRTRV
eukprot:COSAG06_NODE_3258_length_5606_cov_3.545488_2_plen_441_part_00